MRRSTEAKQTFGPQGLNRAVGSLADSVANFADAVRDGMHEREADLRAALGVHQ